MVLLIELLLPLLIRSNIVTGYFEKHTEHGCHLFLFFMLLIHVL